ncbi:alpha/beta hydrolase [Lentzea sp. HUAS12]|uniref:alpha/beta hydrolase n=1 Tax=Lentzea sp. HUAS12 TaxID=2951806 RepID=UPI0020A1863B|nr:alpha/beta hydrolase [Lentzea sp. HUAS12]USX51498.1 alpha/beta hydrolase [Lentzea sp. HUAS12]
MRLRVFGAVLVSSALLVGTGQAVAAPERGAGSIAWQPCAEAPAIECGFLELPVDHARPKGEKFPLAVSRRKASDPSRRIGAMIINPGGPGGSGVEFSFAAEGIFSKEITDRFDVIGFDPRGVARSAPIRCSADVLARQPSLYPRSRAEFDAVVAYNRELRADCRKNTGALFDHVSTTDVAHDIDAVRRALGEKKINYFGVSYGTFMGQQYAELYGRNIRAMVQDSTVDHSLGTWRFIETLSRGVAGVFDEWVKWSDRTPSSPFHGRDLRAVWRGLLAKADRGELKDAQGDVVTAEALGAFVQGTGYLPEWQWLAEYTASLEQGNPVGAFAKTELVEFPAVAVFCDDWNLRVRSWGEYQAVHAMDVRLSPDTRGNALGHTFLVACAGLPKASNPQRPLHIKNAPKILMTNSRYDPATVYEWAVNAHRQTRDTTVFVTYEGWGHVVYERSECTRKINDDYLLSLKLPRDGTRCAAVEPIVSAKTTNRPWLSDHGLIRIPT